MGQKGMAQNLGVSVGLVQSIELRRARITEELALRAADIFGVDPAWLLDGDPTRAIINTKGEAYTLLDAVEAMGNLIDKEHFYGGVDEFMQLCVAYTLLRRILDHAIMTRADRFGFVYRLEQFVRQELDEHPKLREQVFAELRRITRNGGAESSPSILVPVSAEALESAGSEMKGAARAFKSRAARGKKAIKIKK
jgi:transcriptional regulator with XRE-family HTH domain